MAAEDEGIRLLKALRDYRPPKKLHPIAEKAYVLYSQNEQTMTDEVIASLRADLDAVAHDLKLHTDALCGLAAFTMYITEKINDPVAGERVTELIRSTAPRYEGITMKAQSALGDLSKAVKGVFQRFTQRTEPAENKAPIHDKEEPPPEGAIPLSTLKPPATPPPWAKKKNQK